MADVLEEIQANFPAMAWLFDDPEIGPLLRDAVDPNIGFSPNTFQAKVMSTNWWRSRSAAKRNWEILTHNDPAEAARQRTGLIANINYMASQMGVQLSGAQQSFVAELALQDGLDANDPRIRQAITSIFLSGEAVGTGAGAIDSLTKQIFHMGKTDYFLPISGGQQGDAYAWAAKIAEGTKTMEDVEEEWRKRSISLYPHLAEELNAGKTMRDIFSGHMSLIAEELEMSPEEVDLTQGPWLKVIDTWDQNANQHRPMTLSEARTLARQDDRWWATSNAKASASGLANQLLSTFGKR